MPIYTGLISMPRIYRKQIYVLKVGDDTGNAWKKIFAQRITKFVLKEQQNDIYLSWTPKNVFKCRYSYLFPI